MNNIPKSEITLANYDLEKYILPVWQGNIVYNESVMPVCNKEGKVDPISLAYDISEICEVRSSDLATLYEENKDYLLENGKLVILPSGNIPVMPYDEYYPDNATENARKRTGGGKILFIEAGFFHTKQISVTYIHNGNWQGSIPQHQAEMLPKTMEKLKNKQPLKIGFLGDSIFTGCNASGCQFGGDQAPFMPTWFDMLVSKLKSYYEYDDITYVNRARGGTKSYWGVEVVDERLADYSPDIAFIGFGMNDRQTPIPDYYENICKIVERVREKNPDCEFVLTAPMVANREAEGFYCEQYLFVNELNKLKGEGVAVMDVTNVHEYLLTRKSYRDMTGNNLNHPNDFLCRIYAQTALACFI